MIASTSQWSRDVQGTREVPHGAGQSKASKPAQHLLRPVREKDQSQQQPQKCRCDIVICVKKFAKHRSSLYIPGADECCRPGEPITGASACRLPAFVVVVPCCAPMDKGHHRTGPHHNRSVLRRHSSVIRQQAWFIQRHSFTFGKASRAFVRMAAEMLRC